MGLRFTVYGFTAIAIRQLSTQGIQPAVHPLVVFRHCLAIVHINKLPPTSLNAFMLAELISILDFGLAILDCQSQNLQDFQRLNL